ncbi:SDR family oxidoreductase [Sphingomonas mesophila]|uniref:SDR family oxidoreductase n=1 Tax=Sphingomonas mesophila TaxID=2303576 RepID=UPI000E577D6E|nr:SDR family oxidoreductase [Sphingomonas mesophila]
MRVSLKPLREQVMVITGASSGIGLATARRAAAAGASVVLAARNAEALDEAAADIRRKGGKSEAFACDLAERGSAERLAAFAEEKFGRIDSWVNNAAASMLATIETVTIDEHRRVFDVGYFGYVEGSLAAVARLKQSGGALINVGSVLSNRAAPLQGVYSAMKAAVLGFTDALRMELEMAEAPVSVTLIKPGATDTMYIEHARNKLGAPSTPPPPPSILYDPELVAKAICFAAATPRRSLTVGGAGLLLTAAAPLQPRLADLFLEEMLDEDGQTGDEPPDPDAYDNLFEAREDGRTNSNQSRKPRKQSLYLEAQMHPVATAALIGGAAALAGAGAWLLGRSSRED